MTTPTPARYHRSDTLTVEAIQNDADTVHDLIAWIPSHKVRLTDMGGTAAMYIQTIDGSFERVWLWHWVIRYANGHFDVVNNARFAAEFAPIDMEDARPEPTEPSDAEHDAAMLAALSNGYKTATTTASYWAEVAETLTRVQANAGSWLAELPCGHEEWFDSRAPYLPFEQDELRTQLAGLSGLITKAHTLAAIYSAESARLNEDYAAVAPD